MSKKGLLVGCNYPGTNAALRGCINDVHDMRRLLVETKGFPAENLTIMIDTDPNPSQSPTGRNIKAALNNLIRGGQPGDILFFHFSGHGTQIRAEGADPEADGKDEAIVPTDLNIIIDDDLREIVEQLTPGVDFTFVADCCHSGGMLDHAQVHYDNIQQPPPSAGLMDLMAGVMGSAGGGRDFQIKNRNLPVELLSQMLSQRTGQRVQPTNLRSKLAETFGADASKAALAVMAAMAAGGVGGGQRGGGGMAMAMALCQCVMKMMASQGGGAGGAAAPAGGFPPAGQKPPTAQQLASDKGVLISGCQPFETSADACPSGDGSKAFGALTNAITTLVRKHPDITFYQLVGEVRQYLGTGGFSQHPSLECSHDNSKKPFICKSYNQYSDL